MEEKVFYLDYNYCVYKLTINNKYVYIGSTQRFNWRMIDHEFNTKRKNLKKQQLLYETIRQNGGWNNVKCEILVKNLSSRQEAYILEYKFINIYPETISLNADKTSKLPKLIK